MVLIGLGVPPGFEAQAEDVAELVGSKKIQKFSLTGRQIIVNFYLTQRRRDFYQFVILSLRRIY